MRLLRIMLASFVLIIILGICFAPRAKAENCSDVAGGVNAYGFNATISVKIIDANGNPYSEAGKNFSFHTDMVNQSGNVVNSGVYPGLQHVNASGAVDSFAYSRDFTSSPGASANDVVCTPAGQGAPVNAWKFRVLPGQASWYLNCGAGDENSPSGYGFRFYGVGNTVNGLQGHYVGRGSQGDPFVDLPSGSSVNGQSGDHVLTFQLDPKPLGGQVLVNCPTISGSATDPNSPNAQINVDLYFDSVNNNQLVGTEAYQRVETSGAGHTFSARIPAAYQDGRPHIAHVYAVQKPPGSQFNELAGSPISFTCTPAPIFYPWLQTRQGDVAANGSITGQTFYKPGSRNNYGYKEEAVFTAPGTTAATFQTFGDTQLIDDNASLNPAPNKKAVRLNANGSNVYANYNGRVTGVSAYVRGELYGSENPKLLIKITKLNGELVSSKEQSVNGEYQFVNYNIATTDAGAALNQQEYKVELSFTNDSYGGSPVKDRNLVVDQFKVYGTTVSGFETDYSRIISGAHTSDTFCSLNFYFLAGIFDQTATACPNPASRAESKAGYNLGSNSIVSGNFEQIPTAIAQAWNAAQGTPCARSGLPLVDTSTACPNGDITQLPTGTPINGLTVPPGRHTIWFNGDLPVTITGNIIGQNVLPSNLAADRQPVLGIISGGDIMVTPGVTQIDAMVFLRGKFKTCNLYPSAACAQQLVVNGQVISANGFEFGRNAFNQYTSNQNPAEKFVLNPLGAAYSPPGFDKRFWNLDSQLNFSKAELPPRLR